MVNEGISFLNTFLSTYEYVYKCNKVLLTPNVKKCAKYKNIQWTIGAQNSDYNT